MEPARPRNRSACRASVVVLVFALALIVAPSALAHASLVETTPGEGVVLERSPQEVVLRFDEGVSTVAGSVRVFDGEARRVDDGSVGRPSGNTVAVGLRDDLPNDTYTVAWRVLSADSHPVRGAYVFAVGEAVGKGVAAEVLDQEAESAAVDRGLAITRFVGLALILLCVGGVALLAFAVEQRESGVGRAWAVIAACAALLVVDSAAWIALTGVKAAGFGLDAVFRWSPARDVLDASFGKVWVVRAVLAVALAAVAAVLVRRRSGALADLAVLLAACIAVTPALSGHARVDGAVAIVSDAVHVVAAGVWVGGLAVLVLLLVTAGGERRPLAARIVPRFSMLAIGSVIALVATGTIGAILEVGSWSALWETTYGRLVLAKVALLLPLLALGAYHNRISVPRLASREAEPAVLRRFGRTVALELAVMAIVVGVTAVLVAEPPPEAQAAVAVVSRDGVVGPYRYTVTVDPARTGANEIHVYVLDSTGAPAAVDEISVSGILPAVDVGPLRFATTPAGPGHAIVADAQLPLAGDWQLRLDVRKGEFDEWSTTMNVPIRKG